MGSGVNVAHPTCHAQRLALPARQWERAADGGTERWPPNAMVADARYEPHEKSEFLIRLLEMYGLPPLFTLPALPRSKDN